MATNDKSSDKGGKGEGGKGGNASKRGFASMDPEQQRRIASEGGRAAHLKGTAHEFTSEEARRAGAMSHKNDPGRNSQTSQTSQASQSSQSAASGSGARGMGNKAAANDEDKGAREPQQSRQEEEDGGKGGRGTGRSRS